MTQPTKEWLYQKYWVEKKSLNKVAAELGGMTSGFVVGHMIKHNVPRRSRKDAALKGEANPMFGKRGADTTMYGRRGPKSHMWKGGKNSINNQVRECYEYDQWRKACFERDSYSCQHCNQRGGTLNVDHIKQLAQLILEYNITTMKNAYSCPALWNIDNGRTLCVPCHKQTETYGRVDIKI